MEQMVQGDVPYLQHLEEKLSLIEEGLLDHIPKNFYKTVIRYRKELLALHTCYEQLIDAGEDLQGAAERLFGEREAARFGMFSARAERFTTMWRCCGNMCCRSVRCTRARSISARTA